MAILGNIKHKSIIGRLVSFSYQAVRVIFHERPREEPMELVVAFAEETQARVVAQITERSPVRVLSEESCHLKATRKADRYRSCSRNEPVFGVPLSDSQLQIPEKTHLDTGYELHHSDYNNGNRPENTYGIVE